MSTSGSFKTSDYDGLYLEFDWWLSSQSIDSNQSVISWTLKGVGGSRYAYETGPVKCVINGTTVYQINDSIISNGAIVAYGDFTIGHEWDGSKSFSAYAEGAIYSFDVNCSGSGSWALPTIPRASQPSVSIRQYNSPHFGIGDTIVVHMNRKSTVFTHTVVLKLGSYSYTIGTGVTDNISLDTGKIASSLYAQMPNSNSMTGEITVTTYSGSTVIGTSSCKIYAHVVNSNPVFGVGYSDTNSATVAITGNSQYIIRNNSTLQISVSNAKALNSATLKTLTAVVNGNAYTGTLNGSTGVVNVGTVNVSYDTEVTVKIVDSRGNEGQKKITVLVYDWSLPSAIIKLNRKNNYYSESILNVNANYASIGGKNTVAIRYRTKKASDSSYGDYATIQNDADASFTADNEYEWNVQVEVSDRIGKTTYNLILAKGLPITYTDILKNSFGVNCFPKYSKSLEVNGVCISGQVLYDNASGTAETVTLSDSVENYTYIEIFYRSSGDNACGSVKVFSPNGKLVHLGTIHSIEDYDYAKFALVNVSGSTITFSQNYQITLKNNGSTYSAENAIFITRVVGY